MIFDKSVFSCRNVRTDNPPTAKNAQPQAAHFGYSVKQRTAGRFEILDLFVDLFNRDVKHFGKAVLAEQLFFGGELVDHTLIDGALVPA